MPDAHALLGPSGAHRWLACTPSARLEEGVADAGSVYAEEGTLAHRLGELRLREQWEGAEIAENLAEVEANPLYSAAMREHVDDYITFIAERMAEAKTRCADPRIFIEQRVDITEYVPEGFGTADCVIVADGLMDVIDFKYGSGVQVSAEDNPQMKLYGLGCLLALGWAYAIETVRMNVFQPRIHGADSAEINAKALIEWAETELRPTAEKAWAGTGDFCPGEQQCKWCKVGATCRARAEYQMELARHEFQEPPLLTPDELADILLRKKNFESWLESVKNYVETQAVTHGARFPGLKLVEGRSNRKYTDESLIAKALKAAGYKVADIFKPKELLGLTAMEKLVGKKRFDELAGSYIEKPPGAPTLVPESDKRPELNSAAKAVEDFTN